MASRDRITNILGGGTLSCHLIPKVCDRCSELGISHTLLTVGRIEFNRATASEPTDFGHDGITDVSPSPLAVQQAIGNAGSDAIAELNRPFWEPVVHAMVERVLQAHVEHGLVDGQTLWLEGVHTGHRRPAEAALRELKTRLPKQFIVGLWA